MKIILLAFAFVLLSASTFAQNENKPEDTTTDAPSTKGPPTVTSDAPTTSTLTPTPTPQETTSSTSVKTTLSPTPEPTTKSSPVPETTTPSPAPKTTTPPVPETTTPSPAPITTTPPVPETTSVAPTSSPEPPVTTTTPIPVPESGYWNVTEGNTTCIRANLAIRFKIEIDGVVDYILLSPTASSDLSKCNTSDGTELLLLKDNNYMVMFVFEKSADNVFVKNISLTYMLPFSTETFTNDSHFFEVKAGSSYLCKTTSDVVLGNATMEIFSVHVQAFGAEHNKDFGSAEECGADSPINDIVPIAVGVALLALVIVVLIAYLVGRRRSRQKGYQSV